MAEYFTECRNVELSLLYYLEQNLNADWSGVSVVKTFKQAYAKDSDLPIVCVRLADTASTRREVGSTALEDRHLCVVDLFARSDGQRIDLKSYIKTKLETGWVHYDHSHAVGDKSTLERSANGRDYVTDWITDSKIDFGESADTRDKYRHTISVRVRKSS